MMSPSSQHPGAKATFGHPQAELDFPEGLRRGQETPLCGPLGKDLNWALDFNHLGGIFPPGDWSLP